MDEELRWEFKKIHTEIEDAKRIGRDKGHFIIIALLIIVLLTLDGLSDAIKNIKWHAQETTQK